MIEQRGDHGPLRRRRLRCTLAALMTSIVVLSLLLTVLVPLMREGHPPCLTAGQATLWLVARPGAARCADCHGRSTAVMVRSLLPAPSPEPACPGANGRSTGGAGSCISCHGAQPRS
jgi:hypothetical protein